VRLLIVVLIVLVIAIPLSLLLLSGGTVLKLDPPVAAIGNQTPVQVRIENPHGVRRITGVIEQGGSRYSAKHFRWANNRRRPCMTAKHG